MFAVVIGPDGSGKSTLIKALQTVCPHWIYGKEPLPGFPLTLRGHTEARKQHVADKIQPALDAGLTVCLDRYYACTAAYQGRSQQEAQGIFREQVAMFPAPDLWIYVDTPTEIRAARVLERGETTGPALAEEYRYLHLISFKLIDPVFVVDGRAEPLLNASLINWRIESERSNLEAKTSS